ncbi:MAG: hypothetical protein GF334_10995 [Candidatus Altiarchaeales archaeon]|nr:hypothetical protein [Candidatus Altiarchaeales archaeon]
MSYKLIDYTPAEIFNLKNTLYDKGINRGLRAFFYGVNREPPAREALKLIEMHFLKQYTKKYRKYYIRELDRTAERGDHYTWFSMIFAVPYEDLPLYLGSKNRVHRIVAEWRLGLGK